MGLNDEQEKLRQAEQWLENCEPSSQQFRSAWEHLQWAAVNSSDPKVRDRATEIVTP